MILTIAAVICFVFVLVIFGLFIRKGESVGWNNMPTGKVFAIMGLIYFLFMFGLLDMMSAAGKENDLKSFRIPMTSVRVYIS